MLRAWWSWWRTALLHRRTSLAARSNDIDPPL
jgi:hypothetical protein